MASSGVWIASNSVSNATCSWPQEALNSRSESFKPISKWRILRSVFNCTRIWRDVGRQAQNLRVCYTLDLQFRSIKVNQDLATLKPSATESTLPIYVSTATIRDNLDVSKQIDKPCQGCKKCCISQDSIFFGHVPKPCLFPLLCFTQPNYAQPILAVEAFVVVFISFECDQYSRDHVDWGGWKSSYLFGKPLDSNDTYVSIVTLFQAVSILLFQAAYFWLKFREARSIVRKWELSDLQDAGCNEDLHHSLKGVFACKRKSSGKRILECGYVADLEGVYARAMRDKSGRITHYKYEPRFKPPREKMDSGDTLQFNCLSLGQYNTPAEAKIVRHIAAFYYGKDEDRVDLEDGFHFSIPTMSGQERSLSGEEKRKWVTRKAKKVYAAFQKEKVKLKQLRRVTMTGAHSGQWTDAGSDPSPSASTVTYSSPANNESAQAFAFSQDHVSSSGLVQFAASHGGNQAAQHTAQSTPATEPFVGVYSDNCHGVHYNVPEMDNDAPTSDFHGKILGYTDDFIETNSGFELDMIDELMSSRVNIPLHQPSILNNQMHRFGVSDSPGDPTRPQCYGIGQGFESIEPEMRPNLKFHQGYDLVKSSLIDSQSDPVLLQLVNRQKKQLEDAVLQNIDLQNRLSQYEIRNSELQLEIMRLNAMLQQVAIISNC